MCYLEMQIICSLTSFRPPWTLDIVDGSHNLYFWEWRRSGRKEKGTDKAEGLTLDVKSKDEFAQWKLTNIVPMEIADCCNTVTLYTSSSYSSTTERPHAKTMQTPELYLSDQLQSA